MRSRLSIACWLLVLCSAAWAGEEECRLHFAAMYAKSIQSETTAGYHGTSIAALRYAIQHGVLPPDRSGVLFFFPNLSHPQVRPRAGRDFQVTAGTLPERNRHMPYLGAEEYALGVASDHAVLERLGIPISADAVRAMGQFSDHISSAAQKNAAAFFKQYGYTLDQVHGMRSQVEARKKKVGADYQGVVLGFEQSIFDRFKISNAEDVDEGLQLHIPAGLPFQYINGIEPIGQRDYEFLEGLQNPNGP